MASYQISTLTTQHVLGYCQVFNSIVAEKRFLMSSEPKTETLIRQFIERNIDKNPMLVALSAGRVIGWCDVIRKIEPSQAHCGLLSIALLPSYRHKGIGTKLLTDILHRCEQQQIWRIELEVFADNQSAITLYQRFGFVIEGKKSRARLLDGRFQDIVLMARLSGPIAK